MRLEQVTDGRSHDPLTVTADDHHPAPATLSFSDTSTSLPPGTDFNLDVALPHADYKVAKVYLEGPGKAGFPTAAWRESAIVHVTTSTANAIGHSARSTTLLYKVYAVTYSKTLGSLYLTHKIFDTNIAIASRYIALKDAQIIGSTLWLTFHNYFGGSATLSVKGHVAMF